MRGNCFSELSASCRRCRAGQLHEGRGAFRRLERFAQPQHPGDRGEAGVRLSIARPAALRPPKRESACLLTRLRLLLDDLAATVDEVNEFRDRPAGHLRLTMPRPVASFVIAPLLARFAAQYPEIIVDISVSPALTDIVAGRYDAGFRLGNRIGRDMIAVRVTDALRFVVAASPDYLARHPAPEKPQDLQRHNCIRLRFPSGEFFPWRFVIDDKVQELEVEGSLITSDSDLLAELQWMAPASFTLCRSTLSQ